VYPMCLVVFKAVSCLSRHSERSKETHKKEKDVSLMLNMTHGIVKSEKRGFSARS